MTTFEPTDTSAILAKLRSCFDDVKSDNIGAVQAFVIPYADPHQTEFFFSLSPCYRRLEKVSGVYAIGATGVVTLNEAALWVDGVTRLQASQQIDAHNWCLMDEEVEDTPTIAEWLGKVLRKGDVVGADPELHCTESWKTLEAELKCCGLQLVAVENLVDKIWDDRPPPVSNPIFVQPLNRAGKLWCDKVETVRREIRNRNASALVITALEEIAWLLNLRGSDVPCTPVFTSYCVVCQDKVKLYVDEEKVTSEVKQHLSTELQSVELRPYNSALEEIAVLSSRQSSGTVWVARSASYAVSSRVNQTQLLIDTSPLQLMIAVKNPVEVAGMKTAHVKDAVAQCEFFHWLESAVKVEDVTEVSAAEKATEFRKKQEGYTGTSFCNLTAYGKNAAFYLYQPTEKTNARVLRDNVYLLDSGGQYEEGTTDLCRTVHYGTPTKEQKEYFTRVVKGHIALSSLTFAAGTTGQSIEAITRSSLWEVGLDYSHPTGHGIGCFLNVLEGPQRLCRGIDVHEKPLQENMFVAIEPGCYKPGEFGVRFENVYHVVPAAPKRELASGGKFLRFQYVTFVPLLTKLLDVELLTSKEISWINSYHTECLRVLKPKLIEVGKTDVLEWLLRESAEIARAMD